MAVDPIDWYELNAAEAERLADTMSHPAAKRAMLALAENYRQMGAYARMRAKAKLRGPRSLDVGKLRTKKKRL